jgi:hypothetical protein
MKHEMEPVTSDLAGLRNQVRMIANALKDENGDAAFDAKTQLGSLLGDLHSSTVRFCWMSKRTMAAAKRRNAEGIAAYCIANPAMVD